MELTEDFIKMLQIAFLIIGIMSIFLIFVNYNISVFNDEARRESVILLESLLSNNCLTVVRDGRPVKSLFSSEKLDQVVLDSSCIKYNYGKIKIELLDKSKPPWVIDLGSSNKDVETEPFIVAIDLKDEGVKPGKITVSL